MAKPKQFGGEVGTLKKLKAQLKSGGRGPIVYTPKEGITVQFLQEPMTFWKYDECWDDATKRSFPYAEGMVEGKDYTRKSTTFLANCVTQEDPTKVIAYQVKASVLNRLVIKFEKSEEGTIQNYWWEISKYGSGKQTEYDLERLDKVKPKSSKLELLDLGEVTRQAYEAVFGEEDEDDDDEPRKKKSKSHDDDDDDEVPPPKRRKMHRGSRADYEDDDDEEETPPKRRKKQSADKSKKRRKK
jgi:hypothetical protein